MKSLEGTGVALITPFTGEGAVDTQALANLVENCIESGLDYLVILGTTAETATLDVGEKELVTKTVVEANAGRLPLVIGMGGNNTRQLTAAFKAADLGPYEAVLTVSPYYNKPSQEGIYQHYKALNSATSRPIIVYNVPARTGSNVLPETLVRLAADCPHIVGVKEASGDLTQIQKLIRTSPEDFMVISGDDFTALPTVLAGGSGVISVLGQAMSREMSKMISLGLAGEDKAAYRLHNQLKPGMELIFSEGNPAGIKAMLHSMGLCNTNVRLPLVPASPELQGLIAAYLESQEIHA